MSCSADLKATTNYVSSTTTLSPCSTDRVQPALIKGFAKFYQIGN